MVNTRPIHKYRGYDNSEFLNFYKTFAYNLWVRFCLCKRYKTSLVCGLLLRIAIIMSPIQYRRRGRYILFLYHRCEVSHKIVGGEGNDFCQITMLAGTTWWYHLKISFCGRTHIIHPLHSLLYIFEIRLLYSFPK